MISYVFSILAWLLHAFVVVLALTLASILALTLSRLFFHPLAKIPGPRSAAVSNIWYARQVVRGNLYSLGKCLHRQYGPAVRVGPNEVWFSSKEAFKSIYSAGNGYEKSDFYHTLDLLSERDMDRYRLQRRLIGRTYQTSNMKKYEKAVDQVLERTISTLRSLQGAEVDLKMWMHIIVVECLAAVVLSWSPGYLRDKSDGDTSTWSYLGWKRKTVFGLFPAFHIAELLSKDVGRWFANLWGVSYRTPKGYKPFFTPVYSKISRRLKTALHPNPSAPKQPKDTREDLLADLISLHRDRPALTEAYLARLAMTNFGAGHETMCSALTACLAMLGWHRDVQARAAQEIRSLRPQHHHHHHHHHHDGQDGTTTPIAVTSYDDAARNLPYTSASIREAQRLNPVIGMSLPRTVPPGPGLRVHGLYFPPGTTVGCNPGSLHRNPDVFGPDAEAFNPERWLVSPVAAEEDDGERERERERLRAMDRYNLTWGGGARTCPGRHLAELVVWKVVPTLLREFEIQVMMPPDEEIRYYFLAMLTGVKARFLPRAAAE